jgi:tRNA pseudouridine38-40 synthase
VNRYFLYLAYDGADYCGWQSQPNAPSVQRRVEEALSLLARESVAVTGAGRTDAGVHARCMVAHFDAPDTLLDSFPAERPLSRSFAARLNRLLPPDIAVFDVRSVPADAHARFDATSRTYKYYLSSQQDPFSRTYTCLLPVDRLDRNAMNEAAAILLHCDDFTSFAKLHTDTRTNLCHVTRADWDEQYTFTITADRFLRNMVRAIVGTLIDVGRRKLTPDDFRHIIQARQRSAAGTSAPAHALFLHQITYPYL